MISATLLSGWALATLLAFADGARKGPGRLALWGLGAVLACVTALAWQVFLGGEQTIVAGGWERELGIRLRADVLGVAFALVTTAVLVAALAHELSGDVRTRSFPALVAFMAAGLNGLFLTADVFNFYVFFELSMIAAVALTAYGGEGPRLRAAYTFAVVNLLGSVFFLAGTAALYHVTGTLEMAGIAERLHDLPPETTLVIGAVFFVAFGVKLGLFPFHFWVPPVYRDAHPAVAAILSGALANVGSYGLLRFGGDVMGAILPAASPVLAPLAVASLLYGSVLALARKRVAEVLAYSSISQAGYILLAVTLGSSAGFAAALVYALINSLNKALLFLSLRLHGIAAAVVFGMGAASVAGLPPAVGFFGKAAIFRAGVEEGDHGALAAIVGGSILSVAYMARIYARRVWEGQEAPQRSPVTARAVSAVLAAVLLLLGIWPEPLLRLGHVAGLALAREP